MTSAAHIRQTGRLLHAEARRRAAAHGAARPLQRPEEVFAEHLLDALGLTWAQLDDHERGFLVWLAGWDGETTAAIAHLIRRARSEGRP